MYLEVKNLVKHYDSAYPIIKDLTFSIKKGELISFLGESGSGKTTLIRYILSEISKSEKKTFSFKNDFI